MPEFQFDSLSDFLAMGGDAFFVWTSYLLFMVFIFWCVYMPALQKRSVIRLIQARSQREAVQQAHQNKVNNEVQ